MTALETLQKYGLKTDVKSIKERIKDPENYYWATTCKALCTESGQASVAVSEVITLSDELRAADLALLCELAEKGERYERTAKMCKERTQQHLDKDEDWYENRAVMGVLDEIIAESEGEPK